MTAGCYDEFVTLLATRVRELVVGNGLDPATDVGPLIDGAAVAKVREHVDDAVARGARLIVGGRALEGTFVEPTLLADCPTDGRFCEEETFGPVAAVVPVADEDEAVRVANDTSYGLAAYVFTGDIARSWRVAEALETGMVAVNTAEFTSPLVPFGGVKQSGLGREGGREGLQDWLETKYVCVGGIR